MKRLVLDRLRTEADRTLGWLHVYDGLSEVGRFAVLELPWRDNARNISCIPTGMYTITPEVSTRFKDHFRVHGVEGRSGILGHRGNFPRDTQGCLLLGLRFADLDADGLFDVAHSESAFRLLSALLKGEDEAILHIFDITREAPCN